MKHRAVALLASLLLLGVLSAPALAATTAVDQKMELTATNFSGDTTFAQTFTSGYSAPLTGVDLYLKSNPATLVTVSIRPLHPVTKFPTNTKYSTGSTMVNDLGWYHFNTPVDISNGVKYAIVFTLTGAQSGSKGATTQQYSRGSALVQNGGVWSAFYNASTDFAFRTWVSLNLQTPTPVPTAVPTPVPTAPPTPTPVVTAAPTAAPTATPTATPVVTSSPTASPSAVASPSSSASASLDPAAAGDSNGSDGAPMVLIILGVALLGILGGAAGAYLLTRRNAVPPKDVTPTE